MIRVKSDRIAAIQAARAIAVLLIMFVHAVDASAHHGTKVFVQAFPDLAVFGSSGVDLFFVISGFVMTEVICSRRAVPSVGQFLRRRIERIVPLFVIASAVFVLLNPFNQPFDPRSLLYSLTVLPIFDGAGYHAPALYVGWTLGFEFAFYMLVALVLGYRRSSARTLLALSVAAGVAGLLIHPNWAPLRLLLNPLQLEFALGVALWLLWRADVLERHGRAALLAGAGALALGCVLGIAWPVSAHYDDAVSGVSGLARTLDWGLPWALVLAGMLAAPTLWNRTFTSPLRAIGDASYAIYLTHPFALALAWAWLPVMGPGGAFIFAIALAICLGWITHRLIERPVLAWFATWERQRPRRWLPETVSR